MKAYLALFEAQSDYFNVPFRSHSFYLSLEVLVIAIRTRLTDNLP